MIQLNDDQFWLYAPSDLDADRLHHVRRHSIGITTITAMLLEELRE